MLARNATYVLDIQRHACTRAARTATMCAHSSTCMQHMDAQALTHVQSLNRHIHWCDADWVSAISIRYKGYWRRGNIDGPGTLFLSASDVIVREWRAIGGYTFQDAIDAIHRERLEVKQRLEDDDDEVHGVSVQMLMRILQCTFSDLMMGFLCAWLYDLK